MKKFWMNAYRTDPVLFWVEFVAVSFTIAGSLILAISAKNPDMSLVYPLFFVGSTMQVYVSFKRAAAWIMVLTGYFMAVNILGFGRAVSWW